MQFLVQVQHTPFNVCQNNKANDDATYGHGVVCYYTSFLFWLNYGFCFSLHSIYFMCVVCEVVENVL